MRNPWIITSSLILALSIALPCIAQSKTEQMEKVIDNYVATKQFMGAVLIAQGDEIILNKGYGSANLEWNIPNTPTTKFRLGSVTKQFTAASILLLEQQGKLKTTDLLNKHFPDIPTEWNKITIFHLLTHSSGLPNFTNFPEFETLQLSPTTTEKSINIFRDKPLDFQPGEKMSYSNSGYILLGALIEKLSGKTYEAFVQENIFTPLKMNDSGYDSNTDIIMHRAAGYTPNAEGIDNAGFAHMSMPHAAGALYSTTEDLLKWEKALFGGKLLSKTSFKKMLTPYKSDYAFGIVVSKDKDRTVIHHSGGIQGFNTRLAYFPETKTTVIVLANLNGNAPDAIGTALGAIAHGEKVVLNADRKEINVPNEILKKYLGTYQLAPNVTMAITLENNHLISQVTGQGTVPLFAETEFLFFVKIVEAQLEFVADEKHKITHLVLRQNGNHIKAPKL